MIYSAYGLGLASSRPIPRLAGVPSARLPDVRIELNARPPWFDTAAPTRPVFVSTHRDASGAPMFEVARRSDGWFRLSYSDGTDFLVDDAGTQIWAVWPDALSLDDVCSYLLGPIMGFVLRLRGRVCLHASAVAVDGRALALLGHQGAGKSTTATLLASRGFAVLSDDVVPLGEGPAGFEAYPGYPRVRLWPSAVRALASMGPAMPILPAGWGERRYHLDLNRQGYAFSPEPQPLVAVYVLMPRSDRGVAPTIEPMLGEENIMTLIANSFAGNLLDRARRAHDFDVLGRLASSVPVRRVTPRQDIAEIGSLCDAILADFMALGVPAAVPVSVE